MKILIIVLFVFVSFFSLWCIDNNCSARSIEDMQRELNSLNQVHANVMSDYKQLDFKKSIVQTVIMFSLSFSVFFFIFFVSKKKQLDKLDKKVLMQFLLRLRKDIKRKEWPQMIRW